MNPFPIAHWSGAAAAAAAFGPLGGQRVQWGRIKPPAGSVLNHGHPLTRDLLWFPLINDGSLGFIRDLARGNNGTLSLGLGLWSGAKFGRGIQSVTSGNTQLVSSRNIGVSGDSPLTIVIWFAPNDATTFYWPISLGTVGSSLQAFSIFTSGVAAGDVGISYAGGGNNFVTSGGVISAKNWYQLAAVKTAVGDTSTTTRLYINGVQQSFGGGTGSGTMNLADTFASVGAANNAGVPFASAWAIGKFDHCRVYKRALSQQEIQLLYMEPFADVVMPRR